jgi:hypothetical protein
MLPNHPHAITPNHHQTNLPATELDGLAGPAMIQHQFGGKGDLGEHLPPRPR